MHRIFIGYDSTQDISYKVLAWSLKRQSTTSLDIRAIKLCCVENILGFHRSHDPLQSTEFTYTRFLVPLLCNYSGLALFLDSDMLALGDVSELFQLDMKPYALRVVKHDHRPSEKTKMGGKPQTSYPRKNWSSLMLMDCAKLKCWTKEAVETKSGAWLHRFEPIPDALIGDIDGSKWNVLDRANDNTKLIHYTSGGPWLPGCESHQFGFIWTNARSTMERSEIHPREGEPKVCMEHRPRSPMPDKIEPGKTTDGIVVWKTREGPNPMVLAPVVAGFKALRIPVQVEDASVFKGASKTSISYGILRGVGDIYKECIKKGIPWWNLDNGYFKPGHPNGYYRLGFCHLQPRFRRDMGSPNPARFEALGIQVRPWNQNLAGHILLCPPTPALTSFYGVTEKEWVDDVVSRLPVLLRGRIKVRRKGDKGTAQDAMKGAHSIIVHSSNVAMEALLVGIPAIAYEGIIPSWSNKGPEHADEDFTRDDRMDLFHYAAWCQFTLKEYQSGFAWLTCHRMQAAKPVIQRQLTK